MSGIGSLIFTVWAAFSSYFQGSAGTSRLRVYLWIAAALAFLFANWRAWITQYKRCLELETELNDRRAKFILLPTINLWKFDSRIDKTVFFFLCKIVNQGHPSVVLGYTATYRIGGHVEQMKSYHLTQPYEIEVGTDRLVIENKDLLTNKTMEEQIQRGSSVFGRLLFTLEGDRTAQIQAANFAVKFEYLDYLGTKFTADYVPDPEPIAQLIFHGKEKVLQVKQPSPEQVFGTPKQDLPEV
ncbi:MAG TPA: hypothetical protein VME86_08055 [Acidobacteriaceae bacterium]|nr:hypothetical protein [Acidobacteriaceae bacterium]